MSGFVVRENQKRTEAYRKGEAAERLLREMNAALAPLQTPTEEGADRPSVFIFGLPRSGTTLAYQLVAQCLDLGYVNNLIARFWLAPLHGIALSQAVLGDRREAVFESDFGKTRGPYGPHEFAYFWQHWLKVHDVEDLLVFNQPNPEIDWPGLGRMVRMMQQAFGTGIVFKTMYAANHIRAFAETFAMPLFVYVERDPVDVALSILAARKAYYGRAGAWWATYTPDYRELEALTFDRQIAGQVRSLRRTYEEALRLVPQELVLRFTLQELCEGPAKALDALCRRLSDLFGYRVGRRLAPPERFSLHRGRETLDEEQRAVVDALSKTRD